MVTRSRYRGFYVPPGGIDRLIEKMFGGSMGPVEGAPQEPIAVRA